MKLFLDTTQTDAIEHAISLGLLDGVTTNPSLFAHQARPVHELVRELCGLVGDRPLSLEVTESDPARIYEQAHALAALGSSVVVKIPCDVRYFPTIERLKKEGIKINCTLVFSVMQGLCLAKLGVDYISPFIGRIDDIGYDGLTVLENLRSIYDQFGFTTQILAASIRSVKQVQEAALLGADCATFPPELWKKMLEHPLTEIGLQKFMRDWKKQGDISFP